MGALVGGIFAAGKLPVYEQWVTGLARMDVLRLLDPTFGPAGLLKGDRVMAVLRELIGDCAIEDLEVSFTAVATDVASGKEVWLRDGKLFDAIRASIAIPLIFTPFIRGGRRLVDGSLVNPLPIAPTLGDSTDLTVAVTLAGRAEAATTRLPAHESQRPMQPKEPAVDRRSRPRRISAFIDNLRLVRARDGADGRSSGLAEAALSSMETMQNTIARPKLASYAPDVMIEIPRNACGYHEFWRAKELIALGHECAARAFDNERRDCGDKRP